jgi:hypothetical protein
MSPIALDYENEHLHYSNASTISADPYISRRVVFFETELVQLEYVTVQNNSSASSDTCPSPKAVIGDDSSFLQVLHQLIDSGSLRGRQHSGDAWILVVPCYDSASRSCSSYSYSLNVEPASSQGLMVLHPLHSSLVAIGGGGGSTGAHGQKIIELLQQHPIFILPVLTSELAYKTQQTLYRAASFVMSTFDVLGSRHRSAAAHVAVVQLDEVILCEDIFHYFVDDPVASPTIYAVAFRNATESQRTFGCCWFGPATGHALGSGEQLPGELVGQPVTTHYFLGSNSVALMRALLKSSFSDQRLRDGDSPSPILARSLVLDFRAHVSLLNSPIPYADRRAALITDANETICRARGASGEPSRMCRLRRNTAENARTLWTMIVDAQNCHVLPQSNRETQSSKRAHLSRFALGEPVRSSTQFSCPQPPVVAADVVVVNITRTEALVDELTPLFPMRQKSLKEFLLSAGGHYGIKAKGSSVVEMRGRGVQAHVVQRHDSQNEPQCRGKNGWQDVIITYAAGYSSRANIAPLLNTFDKHHTKGCTKLYLFVQAEHVEAFSHEGPDVIPVSVNKYREGFLRTAKCKLLKTRKEIIYLWLKENLLDQVSRASTSAGALRPFRYAMMIDSRDLFFQADPFESIARIDAALQRSSNAGTETGGFMLFPPEASAFGEMSWSFRGGFEFNMRWVLEAFGFSYTQRMFREILPVTKCLNLHHSESSASSATVFPCTSLPLPTICGGIYAGTALAMLDFLKLLVNAMSSRPAKQQDCHNDQGMMNGFLGGGFALAAFPHQILLSNPYSTWATHRPRRGTVRWAATEGGDVNNNTTMSLPLLQNCHGEPYAVVHQLDRFPSIWKQFLKLHK